jgi:L-alanine-DL-glutamate epimerase-like enolase superfamily enzyme
MKSNRRQFLRTAGLATAGLGLTLNNSFASEFIPSFSINRKVGSGKHKMKLRFYPYELKLAHVFTVASFSRTTTPGVQVEIEYDGVIGYGEASMPPYLGETVNSTMEFLRKVNLEQFSDPFLVDDILKYVDAVMPGRTPAKAAIDIALHDLVGKMLDAPWYRVLGLNKASTPSTTYTIGIDKPEIVKEKTKEVDGRFNILKVKLGRGNDEEMIRSVRAITDVPLAVDVNQGWKDKHEALDKVNWLKEQGIVMIEQPMPKKQIDDIAWLTEHSELPIFADESLQRLSDVVKLNGVYSGINIKLMKCTGMHEAWKMVNLGRALGMRVMLGCMTETSCAVSAAAQMSPAVDFADLDGNLLISNDLFEGMKVVKGKITLNDLPGIGLKKL